MNKKILWVDDEPRKLKVSKRLLEKAGYDVIIAGSPNEALEYKDREFDLIILDGLYGGCFELYEKLNAKRKVIYTGDVDIHREVKARGWESHLRSEGISSLIE